MFLSSHDFLHCGVWRSAGAFGAGGMRRCRTPFWQVGGGRSDTSCPCKQQWSPHAVGRVPSYRLGLARGEVEAMPSLPGALVRLGSPFSTGECSSRVPSPA